MLALLDSLQQYIVISCCRLSEVFFAITRSVGVCPEPPRTLACPNAVSRAADLLCAAETPLIIVGKGKVLFRFSILVKGSSF